jgi:hypothetical protein
MLGTGQQHGDVSFSLIQIGILDNTIHHAGPARIIAG